MNMGKYSEGSVVSLANMEDDKHSTNVERKLVTSVGKYPRVAQSSKAKEVQVQGSECEEGEDTAHLSGPSLEIGGGVKQLVRCKMP